MEVCQDSLDIEADLMCLFRLAPDMTCSLREAFYRVTFDLFADDLETLGLS